MVVRALRKEKKGLLFNEVDSMSRLTYLLSVCSDFWQ